MSELLGQHKRFLMFSFVGVLGFFVLWMIVGAIFGGDEAQLARQIARSKADIANALPPTIKVAAIRTQRTAQGEALQKTARALHRNPGEFSLAGVREADLHYNAMVDRLTGPERLERFALEDIGFDESLGRPDKYPSAIPEFEWTLRGLDIVDQMMAWILDVETNVLEGGIARVERVEMAAMPKRSSRRTTGDEVAVEHGVAFTVVGHPIGISALLERIARAPEPGRFVELKEARLTSLDEAAGQATVRPRNQRVDPRDSGRIRARIALASLDIRNDLLSAPEGLR